MLALYCCIHIPPDDADCKELRPRDNPHSRDGVLAIVWDVQPMLEVKSFAEHLDMMVNQGLGIPACGCRTATKACWCVPAHRPDHEAHSKSNENEDGVTYWVVALVGVCHRQQRLFPVILDHNNAGSGGDRLMTPPLSSPTDGGTILRNASPGVMCLVRSGTSSAVPNRPNPHPIPGSPIRPKQCGGGV